jgi:hypothetical protein
MLFKSVGHPLGTAKRVYESCRENLTGCWKVSAQFLKSIGKPLKNARIPACEPIGDEAELPICFWQKCGNIHTLSLKCCVSIYILLKVKGAVENYHNALRFSDIML